MGKDEKTSLTSPEDQKNTVCAEDCTSSTEMKEEMEAGLITDVEEDEQEKPETRKTKKCIKCGKDIGIEERFCHFCGADQNPEPMAVTNEKKGADKRLIAAIGVIVVLLLIIAFGAGKMTNKEAASEPVKLDGTVKEEHAKNESEDMTVDDIEEYAEEVVTNDSSGSSESEMSVSEKRKNQDAFQKLVEATAGEEMNKNCEYNWDYDKDIFFINMTIDGAADGIINHTDNQKLIESWTKLCNSEKEICKAIYKLMGNSKLEDCHVCVNILNDKNPDNVLYSVYDDGYVLFDILNE